MATVLPAKKKSQQSSEKLQNIKVIVRVRPLNKIEEDMHVKCIVQCISQREILTKEKKFYFDRVFKPDADQIEVYLSVVAPMIPDVIAGYNCTVFAYGQTGSGKTYTMTGDNCQCVVNWRIDRHAGCIPRAAAHIFEELQIERHENNVKISYLELYNEEIRDLLSDDESVLPIFNDTKGSVFIQGLTEISVHDSEGLCKQLQKGILKRQTAPTLMNHQSSRSHTVLTITVHTRESTITGEDILKTGKINLVDLAGSENIARSGCKEVRALELANINKSLLTLGRVIQALADKSQKHVPYRDSKLTRILRDSLGGHTKTAIIATISPAANSYEETISTLDYASRARDIKNTPTVNEKLTKTQMIQGLLNEIDRLQKDLDAARDKSGFYVDKENYQRLIDSIEAVTGEKLTMEEITRQQAKHIKELEHIVATKSREFDDNVSMCKKSRDLLAVAKAVIKEKKADLKQERYVAQAYEAQVSELHKHAEDLLTTTKLLSAEKGILQEKLEKQYSINISNETTGRGAVNKVLEMLNQVTEEEAKLKVSDANICKLCREDMNDLKVEIQYNLVGLKKVLDSFDRASIQKLNVKDSIKSTADKYIDLIRIKTAYLRQQLEEHSSHLENFETVDFQRFQETLKTFMDSVHTMAIKMEEFIKSKDLDICKNLEYLKKEIEARKQEDEVIFRKRAKQDNELLQQIASLESKILTRLEPNEDNILTCFIDKADTSRTHVNTALDTLRHAHAEKRGTVPSPRKVDEILDVASEMTSELNSVSTNLEELHLSKSTQALDHLNQSVANSFEDVTKVCNTKVNVVNSRFDFLMDDRETFEQAFEDFARKANEVLTAEFLEKVVPVKHEGDTPLRKQTVVYKTFDPHAPREALIERFKQEAALIEEEDTAILPSELSLSSISFEATRTTDSEIDLEDVGDGDKQSHC